MAYKTCTDCGSRIFEYGCINCNETDYISMQGIYDEPDETEKKLPPESEILPFDKATLKNINQ